MTRSGISVIYIVWKPFGTGVFDKFLHSYKSNSGGRAHRLIFMFKGFASYDDAKEFKVLLSQVEHEALFIEDRGYDIGAYLHAAAIFRSDYYVFLNSRSALLADGWLDKMYSHGSQKGVGLVGATASWESLYTDHLNDRCLKTPDTFFLRSLMRSSFINRARHLYFYPPFPNYHIRTNAFMIRREVLDRVKVGRMKSRRDTSRFENGRSGLTRQILDMRLAAMVVGKDGKGYTYDSWPESGTFWQGDQENLLVADNQTEKYAAANTQQRKALTKRAWG